MKKIAKVLIYDQDDKLLVLTRGNTHPDHPNEDDLPGGEVDSKEEPLDAVEREIFEETGLKVDISAIKQVHRKVIDGTKVHYIFITKLEMNAPSIKISWEHSKYEWRKSAKSLDSKDDYVKTVNDWLSSAESLEIK